MVTLTLSENETIKLRQNKIHYIDRFQGKHKPIGFDKAGFDDLAVKIKDKIYLPFWFAH